MGKTRGGFDPEATRSRACSLSFACLCWAAASFTIAQAAALPQEPSSRAQLLTAKQGRAIVNFAREQEQPARGTQDCSHLVHEIYARAGFAYPYASSFDLYAGSDSFERVKSAQPGDVIVWPGHAGIVFDPKQHAFYSLVSTGLDTEDYEGPYWKSRGRPRFYRYVVGSRASILTARSQPGTRTNGAERRDTVQVAEDRSNADDSATENSAKEASERSAVFGPSVSGVPTKEASVPRSIPLAQGRKQPTREEVAEGISELSSASGTVLRSGSSANADNPIVIFDELRVDSLELKRDHGWAFVQMNARASLTGGETDLNRRNDMIRWELRRGKSGWEAVSPAARTYVPRDVAVRELAARLADLTNSGASAARASAIHQEESRLAKLLSGLFEDSE
jgi:hypothetical protein